MTRDMTDRQFKEALARRGFKKQLLWFTHKDNPNTSHGGILINGKLHRRLTLAHIIKKHDAEMRRAKS